MIFLLPFKSSNRSGLNRIPLITSWIPLLVSQVVFASAVVTGSAQEPEPWEIFIALDNDYLTSNNIDDFYTFGLRLEAAHGKLSYRLDELAFTDRAVGQRFDETYLTIGRLLPPENVGGFCVWVEAGAAHLGRGLLGQKAQNTIHDLTGDPGVHLDYIGINDYHAHFRSEIGTQWEINPQLSWGPQLGLSYTPGFRWNALAGLRTLWRPTEHFTVDLIVGRRFVETDLYLLKPHLIDESLAVLIEIGLPYGFMMEWSLNRYGTDRQHLSFGYHFGQGKSPRRHGAWIQANATP